MRGAADGRVWFAHAIRGPACLLVVLTHLGQQFPTAPVEVAQIGHFEPVADLPEVPWAPVILLLAAVLHVLVETPTNAFGRRLGRRPVPRPADSPDPVPA